jgi:RNA polymerase sigma-70 factor (ECF subfamily)
MTGEEAPRAAEAAARASYGRLLAYLAARSRDIALAEDALAQAFAAALTVWPVDGVPRKPEAWLLTVARRTLIDEARRARVREEALPTLALVSALASSEIPETAGDAFPDERLKLLFVCAHPAIDPAAHAPLMLQTVLGLDAARIARAFLIAPAAMGQRLVRAKQKIAKSGLRFAVPERAEWAARLDAVCQAIYAAFGTAYDDIALADPQHRALAADAIELARLLVGLLPAEAEAKGLLALLLYCDARRPARCDGSGAFVPLSRQNRALWCGEHIAEAEALLAAAGEARAPGRFQIEAAIQSAHMQGLMHGHVPWGWIVKLHESLVTLSPSTGAEVALAGALIEAEGPQAAWARLSRLPDNAVATYQPYWVIAAAILRALGREGEAQQAHARALALTPDRAVNAFLRTQAP